MSHIPQLSIRSQGPGYSPAWDAIDGLEHLWRFAELNGGHDSIGEYLLDFGEGHHAIQDFYPDMTLAAARLSQLPIYEGMPTSQFTLWTVLSHFLVSGQLRCLTGSDSYSRSAADYSFFVAGGREIRLDYDTGKFHPPVQLDCWVLLEISAARRLDGAIQGTLLRAEKFVSPLLLPNWGLSAAASFARSRINWSLIEQVALTDRSSENLFTAEGLRSALCGIHAPGSAEVAQAYADPDLREAVSAHLKADLEDGPRLPAPRLVKSAADAEERSAEIMRELGFSGAGVTEPGADGGVDVRARSAVAQVKMEAFQTGRPVVQALFGAAAAEGKHALFFSLAGYTQQALDWADIAGVACFEFAYDGSVEGRNAIAAAVLRDGPSAFPAPRAKG